MCIRDRSSPLLFYKNAHAVFTRLGHSPTSLLQLRAAHATRFPEGGKNLPIKRVLGGLPFGMPLHGVGKTLRACYTKGFNQAVRRMRHRAQAIGQTVHALAV